MTRRTILAACVAALLAAGLGPARASITRDDFVAIIGPSAEFVAAAGELAQSASDSRAVRAAARARTAEARAISADLAAWRRARARAETAAAQAPSIDRLGPISEALSVPLEAIARTTSAPGYFFTRLPSADRLDAASRVELARLSSLAGAPFDAAYRESDLAALRRLARACKDFILNGDDETLRALAVHALPKLEREIAASERR